MLRRISSLGLSVAVAVCLASPCWSQEKAMIYTKDNAPAAPKLDALPLKSSLSQYGMTWTFDKPVRVGQFVNGDFYVVGPVTVTEISPKPLYGAEVPADQLDATDKKHPQKDYVRNGFMLNPPPERKMSYDSGIKNWFDPSLIQKFPVSMKPGDSLVTTISMPIGVTVSPPLAIEYTGNKGLRGYEDSSPVKDAAVLTCVAEPLPADAFRPAYCDRTQKIYLARNLKRELLPAVTRHGDTPKIEEYIRYTQRPWVNTGYFGFDGPNANMPGYGREVGRCTGDTALLLCCNFTPEQKEPLLDNFVQIGIDYGGMIRAGHPGFFCWGGHGSGRKLPIVFAGYLLSDEELTYIHRSFPKACFGEDEQTAYGDCWTGAKVVFTGHSGIDEATGIGRDYVRGPAWGPYEHMNRATWGSGQRTSEGYRHTASYSWVAQALALRLMHAEKAWDHDAFLDYVDRWMYQTDEPLSPHDRCWENFVIEMWDQYRAAPGMPLIDGWKKQHDDSYYKNAIAKELKAPAKGGD